MTRYAYAEADFLFGHGPIYYRGLSRSSAGPVLLKRIIGGASKRKIESCDKEVSFLRSLHHPGIPYLLDSFAFRLDFYLIFEGKGFHSLKEELDYREDVQGTKALTPEEVQGLFFQLVDILAFVHSKGLSHSKVEPDNILWYAQDGRIKLIDFKAMDDVDDEPATDMMAFGTTIFLVATGTSLTENLEWNYCDSVSTFRREVYDSLNVDIKVLWERLPDAFRLTVELCLVSDVTQRPTVASMLAQPDVRELRIDNLHPFASKSEDEEERPSPLRPASLPTAMLCASPQGSPVTEIDSSDCIYAPSPPRSSSPEGTKARTLHLLTDLSPLLTSTHSQHTHTHSPLLTHTCPDLPSLAPRTSTHPTHPSRAALAAANNAATSSSFYSNMSGVSGFSGVSAESSRCDFYPAGNNNDASWQRELQQQQQQRNAGLGLGTETPPSSSSSSPPPGTPLLQVQGLPLPPIPSLTNSTLTSPVHHPPPPGQSLGNGRFEGRFDEGLGLGRAAGEGSNGYLRHVGRGVLTR